MVFVNDGTATASGWIAGGSTTSTPTPTSTPVVYTFGGFRSPIANPPTINSGKAGRTYPVKWQLQYANGAYVSSLAAVTSITCKSVGCGAFALDPINSISAAGTGSSGLTYDSSTN